MNHTERVKVFSAAIATLVAVAFIALTFFFPKYAILLLSIEVVLLPAMYAIGSIYVENSLRSEHDYDLRRAYKESEKLNKKYYKLARENYVLEEKLRRWQRRKS